MEQEKKTTFRPQDNIRMAGFLEKKGKMKLMSQWKKYWFVLEERLLLYYRSEREYTNLSPCRGSLNMGLVSTVRPGSSSRPCIIHVITRTQVVQLRAKNRETQEIWLQALLHSMSLPLTIKTLKPLNLKKNTLKYGYSLDNIAFKDGLNLENTEKEWTMPRIIDYRKRQISGPFYGGSLDTAIWSKKIKPLRTPSPKIPKNKMLEKILDFAKDSDPVSVVGIRKTNSRLSLCNEEEMKYVGENSDGEYEGRSNARCKVHDENRNHDLYSIVDKSKKKINKASSDTDLSKRKDLSKSCKKSESPFERIKNALSRIPRDKILRTKPLTEKNGRTSKKRRESFLQKVFKKRNNDQREYDLDISDSLYDVISHQEEQPRSLIPTTSVQEETSADEEKTDSSLEDSLYTQIQKPVTGSKTILPPCAMSELKLKLKTRESTEKQDTIFLEVTPNENGQKEFLESDKKDTSAPILPPRRISRPISPWHDVPTNNAPISSTKTPFYVHQALVKFNDSMPTPSLQESSSETEDAETLYRAYETESKRNSLSDPLDCILEIKKNDNLSILLEQLTKITVAPLAEPECADDNYNSLTESEKLCNKSEFSEPDYDVPRPHRPLSIIFSEANDIISSTEFMGRCDNNSDTSSSFRSIEPDSLELTDKKIMFT